MVKLVFTSGFVGNLHRSVLWRLILSQLLFICILHCWKGHGVGASGGRKVTWLELCAVKISGERACA